MKLISLFAVLLMAGTAHAEFMSVQKLNTDLKNAKAGWTAKDTWLNHLSKTDLTRMMGARGVEPKSVEFSTESTAVIGAPEVFDWRDRSGMNYVSPILNQGNCGSCVAFATVGTLETQMNITSGIPGLNNRLSAEALFACGGGSCDYGWFPSAASNYLKREGTPDEACAPYTMGATGVDASCSTTCADRKSRSQRIHYSSSPRGMAAVKEALKKGPMVTTMYVYADFINYSSGVYKHTTGSGLGGHAVSLIGFDDVKRAWIIRNSWGPDWGMSGFGYVSYDDVSGISDDNEQFQIDEKADYLVTSFLDRSFLSGTADIRVEGKAKSAGTMVLKVNGNGRKITEATCDGSDCTLHLDTSTLADGTYTFEAHKGDASLYRYFYVANQAPQFQIKMTAQDFDPSQIVRDRIVVGVNIQSATSVPLKRIALVYENANGELKERWADILVNDMTIGWRTPMVANGEYTLWVRGEAYNNGQTVIVDSNKVKINIQN